jgi:phenylacetate-CoA ligase
MPTQAITPDSLYAMLMAGQKWSAEQMQAHQHNLLGQLLRFAKANVPLYANRLDCIFEADSKINWDRWHDIPVLTRQDVQDAGNAQCPALLPELHGPQSTFRTSGSSGKPISVRISALHAAVNMASNRRFLANTGISPTLRFAYTRDVFLDGTPIEKDFDYWNPQTGIGSGALFVNRRLDIPARLDVLAAQGVDVLVDFPTATELLAHHNLARAVPLRIPYVLGYGMGFSEASRAMIGKSFSAVVLSSYACKEAGALGEQCVETGNFHVNTELVLMEPDADNRGTLITPFFQWAQPFIRYLLDDVVEFSPTCPCGHGHQTITRIAGKVDPIFRFPGGVAIIPFEPTLNKTAIYQWASAMQIAQTAEDTLAIRYVAASVATVAMREELTAYIRTTWHPSLRLTFTRVDDLPRNAGGKQQRFLRENV